MATRTTIQETLGSADDVAAVTTGPNGAVAVQVTGTWTGTIQFAATLDGATWVPVLAAPAGGGAASSTTTANGAFQANGAGFAALRAKFSAYGSGSAVVTLAAQPGTPPDVGGGATDQDVNVVAVGGNAVATGAGAVTSGTQRTVLSSDYGSTVTSYGFIPADDFTVAQATNSTDASFPSLIPTTTTPAASSTRCVITWASRSSLLVMPFGVGSDNNTLRVRVTGWQKNGSLWLPILLADVTGTLSTIVGVSGQVPPETARLCDTLALNQGVALILSSAADNASVAAFEVGVDGFDLVEITFNRNGSATSVNALYQAF